MSLYLVGMADRRLTMWQEKWMLIEDESGDQVGEYLRKTNQENAICDWCNVTAKIAKYAHLGRKNHNICASEFCTLLRSFCTLLRKFVHYTIYLKQE